MIGYWATNEALVDQNSPNKYYLIELEGYEATRLFYPMDIIIT
jgi:hypothetical protein